MKSVNGEIVMDRIFDGAAGRLHIGEPELYIDNEARKRSGHMCHAMIEYLPGKIIDFNSNCSAVRLQGHAAYGWVEYRYSGDYGKTWSEPHDLPYSRQEFFDGNYTISIEIVKLVTNLCKSNMHCIILIKIVHAILKRY